MLFVNDLFKNDELYLPFSVEQFLWEADLTSTQTSYEIIYANPDWKDTRVSRHNRGLGPYDVSIFWYDISPIYILPPREGNPLEWGGGGGKFVPALRTLRIAFLISGVVSESKIPSTLQDKRCDWKAFVVTDWLYWNYNHHCKERPY